MQPKVTVITLGVSDLAKSRAFYIDRLGWPAAKGSNEHISFIDAGGVVLALYPREALATDATVPPEGWGFAGFTLAHNVGSKADVDAALADAVAAGATLLKGAQEVFWGGYSGYFADPDGYLWEVAYNPHWKLGEQGRVELG